MLLVIGLIGAGAFYVFGRSVWVPWYQKLRGLRTMAEVEALYGAQARSRLQAHFVKAGVDYPPAAIALIAIKDVAQLELWAMSATNEVARPQYLHTYPIVGMSGGPGPKLREGDLQVPEGRYRLIGFNPNSSYHLSMKVDYPNAEDRTQATKDGRTQLGGDIFIHGKSVSIGCLAMGDPAIEELFTLVSDVGLEAVDLTILPSDPRTGSLTDAKDRMWVRRRYEQLQEYIEPFRR